jgi:hypothetical protein
MLEMNNGQVCPMSFDLFDQKGKAFAELPAGVTVEIRSSNEQIAQWQPDPAAPHKGEITTLNDDIGVATFDATMTLADGRVLTDSLEVNVVHSAPGTAKLTVGVPIEE